MTEMATMTLRPAQTTDAEPIAALFTEEGYPAGPSDIVARLGRFDHEHGWVIVAEHEDALLGFIALHAVLHVDIPEADYPKLATLDGCVDYLAGAGVR